MMTISKQQWAGIEASIKSGRTVTFDYQGRQVSVHKIQTDETHLAYIVMVDSKPLVGWLKEDHAQYEPLAAIFLRKRLVNATARVARSIAKERGGKAWLKRKENRHYLEKNLEVTDTFFPTAKTVVNHFRKIKRLVRIPMIPVSDSGDFDRASRAGYFLL